jgi:hypothetical protein
MDLFSSFPKSDLELSGLRVGGFEVETEWSRRGAPDQVRVKGVKVIPDEGKGLCF